MDFALAAEAIGSLNHETCTGTIFSIIKSRHKDLSDVRWPPHKDAKKNDKWFTLLTHLSAGLGWISALIMFIYFQSIDWWSLAQMSHSLIHVIFPKSTISRTVQSQIDRWVSKYNQVNLCKRLVVQVSQSLCQAGLPWSQLVQLSGPSSVHSWQV